MKKQVLYLRIEGTINGEREYFEAYLDEDKIDGWASHAPPPEGFLMERVKLFFHEMVFDEEISGWLFNPPFEVRWG